MLRALASSRSWSKTVCLEARTLYFSGWKITLTRLIYSEKNQQGKNFSSIKKWAKEENKVDEIVKKYW